MAVRNSTYESTINLESLKKIIIMVVIVVLTVTIGFMLTKNIFGANSNEHIAFNEVVVKPGDTLWKIAKTLAPGVDTRLVVWTIREENQLESATVYPGQVLRVPVYQ
ncbi:MAG: LysM peptidoglycan-binding domain-containing protein [Firmicutes bacterium]|nr:LysM peptidoglycan-binding domain-containing protein [Bacillota bacterium]